MREFSMSRRNCGILASDLVSGTILTCCQNILSRILASGWYISVLLPFEVFILYGIEEIVCHPRVSYHYRLGEYAEQ